MKKVISISLEILFLLCIAVFLVYDYFPQTPLISSIPGGSIKWIVLILIVVSIFFSRKDSGNTLKWQIFIMASFLVLIGLLTILGGHSTSGISFENKYLWIVLAISLLEIIFQFKKRGINN